jgi:hypothetical protein
MDVVKMFALLQFCFEYALCSRTATNVAHANKQDFQVVSIHFEFKKKLTCTFRADAGLAPGCIRYLIHHSRREYSIHAPAAFGFGVCSLGLFHGTKVRFTTDGAASWIDGVHLDF